MRLHQQRRLAGLKSVATQCRPEDLDLELGLAPATPAQPRGGPLDPNCVRLEVGGADRGPLRGRDVPPAVAAGPMVEEGGGASPRRAAGGVGVSMVEARAAAGDEAARVAAAAADEEAPVGWT